MTRTVADAALVHERHHPAGSARLLCVAQDRATSISVAALTGDLTGLRVAYSPTLGFAEVDPGVAAIVADGVKLLEHLAPGRSRRARVRRPWRGADHAHAAGRRQCVPGVRIHRGRQGADDPAPPGQCRERRAHSGRSNSWRRARSASSSARIMRRLSRTLRLLVTPALFARRRSAPTRIEPSDPRYRNIKNSTPLNSAFNLTKQPAASVPVGLTADGLPVGMQVVGPLYADALVMRACHAMEMARPFPSPISIAVAPVSGVARRSRAASPACMKPYGTCSGLNRRREKSCHRKSCTGGANNAQLDYWFAFGGQSSCRLAASGCLAGYAA